MPEKSTHIRVVTWNVNRRKASVLDALKDLPQLDVLTLQEVTFKQREEFRKRLADVGLSCCCPDGQRYTRDKDYGNLIASRWTINPGKRRYPGKGPPWSELLVQASVPVNGRSFHVINVHIPNGSRYGWKKIDAFEALNDVVRGAKGKACIVVGDFNEPQFVPLQDKGHIVTWGQYWNERGGRYECWEKWRSARRTGEDWDAAVRWMFEEDDQHQMRHAYWELHAGWMPVSHVNRGQPRWFDHIFVSPHFRVEECEYLHELRGPGLSDHSALKAKLVLKA